MKIELIDYKTDPQEVETGTCEFCLGTATDHNQKFVFKDETGKKFTVTGTMWYWGDMDEIYIDNLVEFDEWLKQKDFPDDIAEKADYNWLDALAADFADYEYEKGERI